MRGNLQGSNLVVEESPHGKPVQRLITSAADAAVVHVSGHSHTQSFFASPEQMRGMSFSSPSSTTDLPPASPSVRLKKREREDSPGVEDDHAIRSPVQPGVQLLAQGAQSFQTGRQTLRPSRFPRVRLPRTTRRREIEYLQTGIIVNPDSFFEKLENFFRIVSRFDIINPVHSVIS